MKHYFSGWAFIIIVFLCMVGFAKCSARDAQENILKYHQKTEESLKTMEEKWYVY